MKLQSPLLRVRALEALADPDCEWIFECSPDVFGTMPGNPIGYWASEGIKRAFSIGDSLSSFVKMPYGFKTGDNEKFLRLWWECSESGINLTAATKEEAQSSSKKWFPYNKGGAFRKWYGNNEYLLNYENGGEEVIGQAKKQGRSAADYDNSLLFKPVVTWSRISSGRLHMRYSPGGAICDMTGSGYYGSEQTLKYLQAFCNSSVALAVANIMSPTLDFQPGQIGSYPIIGVDTEINEVSKLVEALRYDSKQDWDAFEESWDFNSHPLI